MILESMEKGVRQLREQRVTIDLPIRKVSATPTNNDVRAAVKSIADDLLNIVANSPEILKLVSNVAGAIAKNEQVKNEAITAINHSPIVSFDYSDVQQTSADVPTSTSAGAVTAPAKIPNLSNFNLIAGLYLVAQSQFTLNASTTIFNSVVPGAHSGRIRDYRIAGQFDIPLPEITNIGKPSLSLSGLYLHLLEEPLGQQVLVNGVAVSRTGGIDLFQAKLTIPAKDSGVKIPISITAANRTELIKERDIRGTIGISFDFDSLFSKPQ